MFLTFKKALLPIEVIELGISTVSNPVQPLKAFAGILVTLLPKVMVLSDVLLLNAVPMLLLLIVKFSIWQSLKLLLVRVDVIVLPMVRLRNWSSSLNAVPILLELMVSVSSA